MHKAPAEFASKMSLALSNSLSLVVNMFVEPRSVIGLVEDMRLYDMVVLLVAAEPTELGGCGYGPCLVNVLCPSHMDVLPFDAVENRGDASLLEGADA